MREGEFANAQNSAGVPEIARAKYNQLVNGERLSENQRKDFLDRAGKLFEAQAVGHRLLRSEYTEIAERRGLDARNILPQFEQEKLVKEKADNVSQQISSMQIDENLKNEALLAIKVGKDPAAVLKLLRGN